MPPRFVVAIALVVASAACSAALPPAAAPAQPPVSARPAAAASTLAPKPSYVVPIPTFSSPTRLASALRATDRVVHAAAADDAGAFAAAARTQQAAYRQLVLRPTWRSTVLAELPLRMRATARQTIHAGAELRTITAARPTLPPWRIVKPASAATLLRFYRAAQRATGINWSYLAAVNFVETKFGRLRGVSTSGAQGPMQFLPSTWALVGRGDVNDPYDAIMAAARYLVLRGAPGNMPRALYGYNPSWHYVAGVSSYASVMRRDIHVFQAYYDWQVAYHYVRGDVFLLEGYRPTR
jgi:membrane-bound lytic murein transglycosylase B